jgi:hypothetical protein
LQQGDGREAVGPLVNDDCIQVEVQVKSCVENRQREFACALVANDRGG